MGSGLGPSQGPPGRRSTDSDDGGRTTEDRKVLGSRRDWSFDEERSRQAATVSSVVCPPSSVLCPRKRALINESDQAERAISTGKLHALPHFHTRPIDVVVFHGSSGRTRFEGGFPLRCLQRLSRPHIATLQCGWRHNRSTRGASIPVLSY
jgi:hypothetical protein